MSCGRLHCACAARPAGPACGVHGACAQAAVTRGRTDPGPRNSQSHTTRGLRSKNVFETPFSSQIPFPLETVISGSRVSARPPESAERTTRGNRAGGASVARGRAGAQGRLSARSRGRDLPPVGSVVPGRGASWPTSAPDAGRVCSVSRRPGLRGALLATPIAACPAGGQSPVSPSAAAEPWPRHLGSRCPASPESSWSKPRVRPRG